MVFTNDGKKFVAYGLGSNVGMYIRHIGIGTGSSTISATDHTLVTETNRTSITGSPDFSESQKVIFQADFNSIQMSGINLTEFGLFNVASGPGFTGSVWAREGFGSVVFDGTNELQVSYAVEVL